MKTLTQANIDILLTGALFYGTGGGGNPERAKQIMRSIAKNKALPSLISSSELPSGAICITGFPVGGLKSDKIPLNVFNKMLKYYRNILKKKISAIVPVEIGPLSLAVSLQLASSLRLPLVDADIVGGRSSPEVFLETITLFSIPRTPLVVFNAQGAYKTLTRTSSYQDEERFLRSFAADSGGFAYVFGYPLSKKSILVSVTPGTVSQAIRVGRMIQEGLLASNLKNIGAEKIYQGTVGAIEPITQQGFASKFIDMQNGRQTARLFAKNENIILWINKKVALTCPDLLVLVNNAYVPIFNENLRIGMPVIVLGIKSVPLWRTQKGKWLFSPKTFGFPFQPVLL
ncbi:hypothetical protein A2875_03670 [Candidatus Gottesmanbacteria bacterium RIFCSPHIGHO2_01_FULL_46_14]|uniref:DUF917 domain-containing protein n=3 Tax=Candidatus Gottesmaniibacteriota TaxID=1752720 RepID=A0A1F5ZN25_9BACT|nr:MAG: hypothetical protein UY08_C0006G0023 [Candidatus Gottesmanbacteria bacterium GW2011_GWA1_47_8]OGG13841.1 MAG: hypothetical protein A2875_03670 [Candidatus Gottesmanbacteria bacterium RIFCSPHIGHO2_01_FULL_46_14]OGG29609.1 MAG: hypothetical protein A2971_01035 [Candidatus Gottesmanbacteria bacterium RIFCSPLOWO2_01_FULL_46_21]